MAFGVSALLGIALVILLPSSFVDDRRFCSIPIGCSREGPEFAHCRFGPIPPKWIASHPMWPALVVVGAAIVVVFL